MASSEQYPRFRFNDGRLESFRGSGRLIAFVCEEESCHSAVLLSAAAYEARRPGPILCDAHTEASSVGEPA